MIQKITKIPIPPPSDEVIASGNEVCRILTSYTRVTMPYPGKDSLATSVILRAGERLFAVTAKHCVTDEVEINNGKRNGRIPIVHKWLHKNLDIALLELEPQPNLPACSLDQLTKSLPQVINSTDPDYWVAGFPRHSAKYENGKMFPTGATFATSLLAVCDDALTLYYHEQGYKVVMDSNQACAEADLPLTPHGFSGGGVWFNSSSGKDSTLFNPLRHIQLIGIQYSWDKETRILKAVPSLVIWQMLQEACPDVLR